MLDVSISVSSKSPWGGSPQCNVLPVSLGKVVAVKVFPAKTVCEGRALRVPHGERGKGILGPFRREGEL